MNKNDNEKEATFQCEKVETNISEYKLQCTNWIWYIAGFSSSEQNTPPTPPKMKSWKVLMRWRKKWLKCIKLAEV